MTRTGTIAYVEDRGAIVEVRIDVACGDITARVTLAGDGNPTRRALHAAFGDDVIGQVIDFESESWGGLKWFAPAGGES